MSAFRDKKKSRPRRGQAVTVYDGRNWPVVKCGAVYLSEEDKTKHVTKKIVHQATSSSTDKKKKSSKYTLAIGSSFGHVHAFLNDTDTVLSALESTQAEDKCLMLIRKPKSASRQMLKAHSWANLHEADESAFKGFNLSLTRNKGKLNSRELALLPDGSTATRWHQLPVNLSQTELSAVSETDDETRSEVLSRESEDTLDSLSNSYPYRHEKKQFLNSREKSRSSCDINFRNYEINNSRPGVGNARPDVAPPAVPTKNSRPSPPKKPLRVDDKNNNRTEPQKSWARGESSLSVFKPQSKSDSNFHGNLTIRNDQFYEPGGFMTHDRGKSSSGVLPGKGIDWKQEHIKHHSHWQKCDTVPKTQNSNSFDSNNKTERSRSDSNGGERSTVTESLHGVPKGKMLEAQSSGHRQHRQYETSNPNIHSMSQSMHNGSSDQNYNYKKSGLKYGSEFHSSASVNEIDRKARHHQSTGYPQQNNNNNATVSTSFKEPPQHDKQHPKDRRRQDINSDGNDESVVRSKSLGDLSARSAFSVARSKEPQSYPGDELSGKEQSGQHKRRNNSNSKSSHVPSDNFDGKIFNGKVRQPQQKHDSLPMRVKGNGLNGSDTCSTMDQIARRFEKMPLHANMQYGSLQQLNSNMEIQQRHLGSSKHREKTPLKPRRTLPQVPGDVDERIKHYGDIVKMRVSLSSRGSATSSGSQASNQNVGNDLSRHARPCETPSDREVSELLQGHASDGKWEDIQEDDQSPIYATKQNGNLYEQPSVVGQSLLSSDSFGSHDHGLSLFPGMPSGGRLSETGQTTLTSQSTIDSGYTTNDQEQDMPSSSNYALSLKQSAQNMYMNKLLKSSNPLKKSKSPVKDKDIKTQSWVEQHPCFAQGQCEEKNNTGENPLKSGVESKPRIMKSHNAVPELKPPSYNEHINNRGQQQLQVSEMNGSVQKRERVSPRHASDSHVQPVLRTGSRKSQNPAHRLSDLSVRDIEKVQTLNPSQSVRGKSMSMSYGLNLIEPNLSQQSAKHVSKSQPRFTGSLLNLVPTGSQLQQMHDGKGNSQVFGSQQNLYGTLPGGWKPGGRGLESSLRMIGKPSLFQLLQSYQLYPVRVKLPENFSILDNLRLIECEVVLPSPWSDKEPTSVTSPKGSYAKLGGPGSAFKPVVSGNSGIGAVTMVTVVDLSAEVKSMFMSGQIIKGDLIVEVNEQLMMGEELSTLKTLLQSCHQGELLITVARDKARDSIQRQNSNSSDTEGARKMEDKISHLKSELRKKDRTLEQLNALLPWKQSEENNGNKDGSSRDSYICSLSEDEFIV